MVAGVRGRLITATFARTVLATLPGAESPPPAVARAIDDWAERYEATAGPASGLRSLSDVVIVPLLRILGFQAGARAVQDGCLVIHAGLPSGASIPVVVVPWGEPLHQAWRQTVLDGLRTDARWCFCCNGTSLRLVDAQRTWARDYLEFDLALLGREPEALTILWSVARAAALASTPPLLDRAVELSARHGVIVCKGLGRGVAAALGLLFEALARTRQSPQILYEHCLTVLYRVLFLLFSEARGLVPIWHPVYRDRYSLEAIVSALSSGRRYRGIWPAIQAISRLASNGCVAGELKVTAFNGRLFSTDAPALDRARISDEVMAQALLAIATTDAGGSRLPIAFRDLDVEQLGSVYEHLLEYEPPAAATAATLDRTREGRKSSGSFYTPRAVTAHVVRRTLGPLVRGRSASEILALRVCDPAMGSGAFLVAACRFLAAAAEDALVRDGEWHAGDVTAAERLGLRREIVQRCLFGVDLNPMAAQLARLSLWLATLAFDKPLTFLDHHLVTGDSLVGASPDDLRRQPAKRGRRQRRHAPLPLFEAVDAAGALDEAARLRLRMAAEPDDSAAIVRRKERALADLHAPGTALARWSLALDLWCASWFWDEGSPPDARLVAEVCARVLGRRSTLSPDVADQFTGAGARIAHRRRFLHWPVAFPEVFAADAPGFDAVVGNPPWDMVRGDAGDARARSERGSDARQLIDFVREAGVYAVEQRAHVNRYQLFLERALQLTRRGGRIGLVLPSGLMTDAGAAPLRRHLFERADIDAVAGLDNRDGIFPIHRSVRFVLMTSTAGRPTTAIACRFGITDPEQLEQDHSTPLLVTRGLIARVSGGDDLAVPQIAGARDLRILESITARVPSLGSADGWAARFHRELNASDDRDEFAPYEGGADSRPVLEGKQVEPFRVAIERSRHQLRAAGKGQRIPRRSRLAYRDVASATNRLTLIAAIVPARAVTTHTLFCLATPLSASAQQVLCALLNSFVANYLVRMRVSTHVTASLVSRLRVPLVTPSDPAFARLDELSRSLACGQVAAERMDEYVELQALVARLYGLMEGDFEHVLETFPLIAIEVRSAALRLFVEQARATETRRNSGS